MSNPEPTLPLTPPEQPILPTSASTQLSESAPASTPPQPQFNAYISSFTGVVHLVSQSQWEKVAVVCEDADLSVEYESHPSRLLATAPLVLTYLILDDLPPARFALMRLPNTLASQPLSQALFSLLASAWERKYTHVYSRADAVVASAREPELQAILATMTQAFITSFRQRTLDLLERAYSSLPLTLAQSYLGLPPDDILTATKFTGRWSYDPIQQTLTPVAPGAGTTPSQSSESRASSLPTFVSLLNGTARLETIV